MIVNKLKISFLVILIFLPGIAVSQIIAPSLVTELSKKVISINVNFT